MSSSGATVAAAASSSSSSPSTMASSMLSWCGTARTVTVTTPSIYMQPCPGWIGWSMEEVYGSFGDRELGTICRRGCIDGTNKFYFALWI